MIVFVIANITSIISLYLCQKYGNNIIKKNIAKEEGVYFEYNPTGMIITLFFLTFVSIVASMVSQLTLGWLVLSIAFFSLCSLYDWSWKKTLKYNRILYYYITIAILSMLYLFIGILFLRKNYLISDIFLYIVIIFNIFNLLYIFPQKRHNNI